MGACIWKRVVYDMMCKRFQFFVNVEALLGILDNFKYWFPPVPRALFVNGKM